MREPAAAATAAAAVPCPRVVHLHAAHHVAAAVRLPRAYHAGIVNLCGSEALGRLSFAEEAVSALNSTRGSAPRLDAALLKGVQTMNAGQAAKRPLASGLTLDKAYGLIPGWKPRTVKEALAHWMSNPRGKPLGE